MNLEPEEEDLEFQELLDQQTNKPDQLESTVETLETSQEKWDWRIRLTIGLSILILISMFVLIYIILNPPGDGIPEPSTSP